MIKYVCNKCCKELLPSSRYRVEMRIKGFSAVVDTFDCDYCEGCLADIVGAEVLAEIKRRESERKKRAEERRKMKGGDE